MSLQDVLKDRARLAALQRTALLNQVKDPELDRLAKLAMRIIKAPISLVTLVNSENQFFCGCVGLPEPFQSRRQTGMEHSFCQHVLQSGDPLVIADARKDPLVHHNLAIRDMGFVAYLGIPLQTCDGHILGSFCIVDSVPRVWTEEDIYIMQQLSRSVITEMELRAEVAERIAAEAELKKVQRNLEDRVQQRTAEIAKLNAELEARVIARTDALNRANEALSAFSYTVSHDLKAPLRAITGFADILLATARHKLDEDAQRYLDHIAQSGVKMSQMIDELLTYAKLGQRALRPQMLNLRELLGGVVDNYRAALDAAGGQIYLADNLPTLTSDRTILQQIFSNLIDNAIKYRRPEVPPRINISSQEQDRSVIVSVSDNGVGIPPEFRTRVFDLFRRVDANSTLTGTGVGLAIVRKAAEMLGGEVWIGDQPEGTVVHVRLPESCEPRNVQ